MFTGLIAHQGVVKALQYLPCKTARLWVRTPFLTIKEGESLAVNGVCLTVLDRSCSEDAVFDISPETSQRTTLTALKPDHQVHLERAMLLGSAVGGHMITGHVDTTLCVLSKQMIGDFIAITLGKIPPRMRAWVVEKGSVAIDGVSLTINTCDEETLSVMLIPYTLSQTHLGALCVQDKINIEFDCFMKKVMTFSNS